MSAQWRRQVLDSAAAPEELQLTPPAFPVRLPGRKAARILEELLLPK